MGYIPESAVDVIRQLTLTDNDLTWTNVAGSAPTDIVADYSYLTWDEISHFSYLKETLKWDTGGVGVTKLVFDFPANADNNATTEGWLAEPEHQDATTTGVLATGWARWKNGWNEPVSIGNANLKRVSDGPGGYKYQIECNVADTDALLGVTFDTLEIELNYNTETEE